MAASPLPEAITSLEEIQRLVVQGFRDWSHYGSVSVRSWEGLLIFNYTTKAVYEARWNFFECVSRGLIINSTTGEIVGRGFDKFWNWLQGGRRPRRDAHIVSITDKIDGSLAVLYRHTGQYRLATRGSFDSPQARWATSYLNTYFELTDLPEELSLLFEVVYPGNRIVVDYGAREDLVLLAARNRHTGAYLPFYPDVYNMAQTYGFTLPQTYTFNDITQVIEQAGQLDLSQEGFVVEFSDGSRFKFKGDRYLELQRLITGLSFRNTLRAVANNALNEIFDRVPDEFLTEVRQWVNEIQARVQVVTAAVDEAFAQAPRATRREFAVWVMQTHPQLSHYLFARFDQQPLEPLIYVKERWEDMDRTPPPPALEEG